MGSDSAANFARRSPWPMINILRTPQVMSQKWMTTALPLFLPAYRLLG